MKRPSDEFWELSYREINACMQDFKAERDEEFLRAGTIAAMVMNATRTSREQKIWTSADFFGTTEVDPEIAARLSLAKWRSFSCEFQQYRHLIPAS